jgi:hypothetical protein
MGQTGFFDLERRLDGLSAKGDPLEPIKTAVPWEAFRTAIEAVTETKPEERESNIGRKPDLELQDRVVGKDENEARPETPARSAQSPAVADAVRQPRRLLALPAAGCQ